MKEIHPQLTIIIIKLLKTKEKKVFKQQEKIAPYLSGEIKVNMQAYL